MSATLNLTSSVLAHGDLSSNNNPALRFVDWKRQVAGLAVENPVSERLTVQPGASTTVFDGSRSLGVDGTTAFDLTLTTLSADRYRLSKVSGTSPAFRTDRGLNLAGIQLTLVIQVNGSMLVTVASGTPFSALQAGDDVFIPGVTTGDLATVFAGENEGFWKVLAVGAAGANVTLIRPTCSDQSMLGEVVTPVSASQFQGFSGTGVQIGDKLDLSGGFATSAQKTFSIVAVTPTRVDFISTSPLAQESGILPGASGIKVYGNAKQFLRLEADQEAIIRLNGDTGSSIRLAPWVPGDPNGVAEFTKVGPTWGLAVINKSVQTLRVNVISAE